MPIYEYECVQCGTRFSQLRQMRDMDAPAHCPRCGNEQARRMLSVIAPCCNTTAAAGAAGC